MLEKIYASRSGTLNKGIEQNLGTPAFTAAVTASLMAAEGIKILAEKISQRKQKVLFFDLLEDEWQSIPIGK